MNPEAVLARILAAYFPSGLPADDAQAREMVRRALAHLLLAPVQETQPA